MTWRQAARWKKVPSGWVRTNASHAGAPASSSERSAGAMGSGGGFCQAGRRGSGEEIGEHGVDAVPGEITKQPVQAPGHGVEVQVMAEARHAAGAADARLAGVDLPGME